MFKWRENVRPSSPLGIDNGTAEVIALKEVETLFHSSFELFLRLNLFCEKSDPAAVKEADQFPALFVATETEINFDVVGQFDQRCCPAGKIKNIKGDLVAQGFHAAAGLESIDVRLDSFDEFDDDGAREYG